MIMRAIAVVVICLLFQPLMMGAHYFRRPPKDWLCVDDAQQLPAKVLVLYMGRGSTRFAPTIHVSFDPLSQPLEEYIANAKQYHSRPLDALCTDLGQLMTHMGPARLVQIQSPSVYGEVSLLQAYLAYEGQAYVITGIALKEDFKNFSPLFYETVQTFDLAAEKGIH